MTDATDFEAQRIEMRDQHAQHLAAVQIKRYAQFHELPVQDMAGNVVLGWERRLNTMPLSKLEADYLLTSQIRRTFDAIHAHTFGILDLSEARLAVVLHLCVLLGIDQVRDMAEFWRAMRARDYEAAAEQMMLSMWPKFIGNDSRDKRRALDILYMLRTGHARPAPHGGSRPPAPAGRR